MALRAKIDAGATRAVVLGAGFIGIEAAEALAHPVLAQSGFDSASLSGGALTLRATLGERTHT